MRMMKKLKKAVVSVLLASMALYLCACGNTESKDNAASKDETVLNDSGSDVTAETSELTKVKIGIDTEQLAFVQIVALKNGYFEENGIDAELTGYAAGIETLNAIVLGEVEIGGAYDYAACTRLAEKTNLRLASSYIVNKAGSCWYDTSIEGATSAADLQGKRIGILQGTLQEYLWAKELESVGLSFDDVEISYLGSNAEVYTAYVSGAVDAVIGTPQYLEQLEAVGERTVLNTAEDIGQVSQAYIMADNDFLTEHADLMEGYYTALQQALDYMKSNPQEASKLCAEYLTLAQDDVLNAFDSYNYELRFLQEDYDHLQEIADWCYENEVTDEISVKDYMNIDSIQSFAPEQVTYVEE